MDRKAIHGLAGICCITVGAIAFLAIPRPGSVGQTQVVPPGTFNRLPGTYFNVGAFDCGVFDYRGACTGNFSLRVAAFILFLIVGVFFLMAAAGRLDAVAALFSGSAMSYQPVGTVVGFEGSQGTEFHDVWVDEESEASKLFWCRDCSFTTGSIDEARRHKKMVKGSRATSSSAAIHVGQPSRDSKAPETRPDTETATVASNVKTCPDCAESVKAAARKCRFCGYLFEAAPSNSTS